MYSEQAFWPLTNIHLDSLGCIDLNNQNVVCTFKHSLNPNLPQYKNEAQLHGASTTPISFIHQTLKFTCNVPIPHYFSILNSNLQIQNLQAHLACKFHNFSQIMNYPKVNLMKLINHIKGQVYIPNPHLISKLLAQNLSLKQALQLRSKTDWRTYFIINNLSASNQIHLVHIQTIVDWPLVECVFPLMYINRTEYISLNYNLLILITLQYLHTNQQLENMEF